MQGGGWCGERVSGGDGVGYKVGDRELIEWK